MSHQLLPNIKEYRKNLLILTSKKKITPTIKTGCSACGKSLYNAKKYSKNKNINQNNYSNKNINQNNYSNKKKLIFENNLHNNFSFSVNF